MSQQLGLVGYKAAGGPLPPNTQELSEGVGGFKVFCELCSLVSEGWLKSPCLARAAHPTISSKSS